MADIQTKTIEANFDGLIGPSHNYGGLSVGNLASVKHQGLVARPKEAALQGLEKMWHMHSLGLVQGILPPHERPFIGGLKALGFEGDHSAVLSEVTNTVPHLLRNYSSASAMWAANAATISPSADSRDGKLHFTPANLSTMLHRSIEAPQTQKSLQCAFGADHFVVHAALPSHRDFSDEGAANHVRLCADHAEQGVEIFVYGRDHQNRIDLNYPARQTKLAGEVIARRHGLDPTRTVMIEQSSLAINAGAFHNDVVCVGAKTCLFYHEYAFENTKQALADIKSSAKGLFEPQFVEVKNADVPIKDAISAYLFNAMLVQIPGRSRLTLIAPTETRDNVKTKAYCDQLIQGNGPIGEVIYVDVRQSMCNGGGPACLRLRVVLTPEELAATNPSMILGDHNYDRLRLWVQTHYRDRLVPEELGDPKLLIEIHRALDELCQILDLGDDFYPFQNR